MPKPNRTCCWPKCQKPLKTDLPLCSAHVHVVVDVASRPADPNFVYRYRGTIAEPEPDQAQPTEGTVYYLRSGAYIKIGWSSDLEKRMRAYAPDSLLLATEPGTRKDEQRRHKMFAAHRTHGREWYAMVPSLIHHIDLLIAEHGGPDPVAFAAQPVGIPQPRPAGTMRPSNWRGSFTT